MCSSDLYVIGKFGARAGDVYGRVKAVGASVGIDFNFDGIVRQPNTLIAHSLIALAETGEAQSRLVQALFDAYFLAHLDLTNTAVLAEVARQAGLPESQIDAALNDAEVQAQVKQADERARNLGINGVPFFIFNGELAVSGAQEPEQLLAAMAQAQGSA